MSPPVRVEEGAPACAAIASAVERRLEQLLAEEAAIWSAVDERLTEPVAALSAFVLAGGKRLRPVFADCGFRAAGGDPAAPVLLDVACALELLHAFALLHDDVMDGSFTRRGYPALHVQLASLHREQGMRGDPRRYGEGIAVLIGDLAFAAADRLVSTAPASVRRVWAQLRIELVMGQYLDISASATATGSPTQALLVARYKSGAYTVERPLQLGATAAGAGDALQQQLAAFGRPLGEAFQLRDDLLGVFGEPELTGKPVGEDIREGKQTLLLQLAKRLSGDAERRLLDRAGCPGLSAEEVSGIAAVIEGCGAHHLVEREIERRYCDALDALGTSPLPEDVEADLRMLAERCLWRAA